jgi:hypothetical protein
MLEIAPIISRPIDMAYRFRDEVFERRVECLSCMQPAARLSPMTFRRCKTHFMIDSRQTRGMCHPECKIHLHSTYTIHTTPKSPHNNKRNISIQALYPPPLLLPLTLRHRRLANNRLFSKREVSGPCYAIDLMRRDDMPMITIVTIDE